jgi:hypothetical protein
MGLEESGSTTRVSSLSRHTWLNSVLGLSLRNQSSKVPEVGHSGAADWFCTVTLSLVKWKAGNRTTGVRVSARAGPGITATSIQATKVATSRLVTVFMVFSL